MKTLVVELMGEGVSEGARGRGEMESYAHPNDLATSIRPYDGFKVVYVRKTKSKCPTEKECVRSGIRTHAYMSRLRPERSALDRSAILTPCLIV